MSTKAKASKKRTSVKKSASKGKAKAKVKATTKVKSVKAKPKAKSKTKAKSPSLRVKLKMKSAKMIKKAKDGLKQVMNLEPALKQLEEKMLPEEFVKVLAKVEKTLEEFNAKVARKL